MNGKRENLIAVVCQIGLNLIFLQRPTVDCHIHQIGQFPVWVPNPSGGSGLSSKLSALITHVCLILHYPMRTIRNTI